MQFSKEKDAKFSDPIFLKKILLVENKSRALYMQKNALPFTLITVLSITSLALTTRLKTSPSTLKNKGHAPLVTLSLVTHLTMLSVSTTASIFFAMNNNKIHKLSIYFITTFIYSYYNFLLEVARVSLNQILIKFKNKIEEKVKIY